VVLKRPSVYSVRPSSLSEEDALDQLEDQTAEDDETEEDCCVAQNVSQLVWQIRDPKLHSTGTGGRGKEYDLLNHMGEMGALEATFLCWCFRMASSDLPLRASCSFANLALRRLCSGVWAWGVLCVSYLHAYGQQEVWRDPSCARQTNNVPL
jgi:hypothetical protein